MSEFSKPVLALDSSMGGCTVAVWMADGRHFSKTLVTEREQAAKLIPMVQAVLAEAGIEFADLGLIVTTVGPGSFTGLRISLSAARSLGLALGAPVQGVSTFDLVRRTSGAGPDGFVVLESKRTDFYVDGPGFPAGCYAAADVASALSPGGCICGDGVERLARELPLDGCDVRACVLPDPVVLARMGLARFLENGGRAEKPEPVYLRGADVSMPNKMQREISNFQH